jgi:hypothetical protein
MDKNPAILIPKIETVKTENVLENSDNNQDILQNGNQEKPIKAPAKKYYKNK